MTKLKSWPQLLIRMNVLYKLKYLKMFDENLHNATERKRIAFIIIIICH